MGNLPVATPLMKIFLPSLATISCQQTPREDQGFGSPSHFHDRRLIGPIMFSLVQLTMAAESSRVQESRHARKTAFHNTSPPPPAFNIPSASLSRFVSQLWMSAYTKPKESTTSSMYIFSIPGSFQKSRDHSTPQTPYGSHSKTLSSKSRTLQPSWSAQCLHGMRVCCC